MIIACDRWSTISSLVVMVREHLWCDGNVFMSWTTRNSMIYEASNFAIGIGSIDFRRGKKVNGQTFPCRSGTENEKMPRPPPINA